MRREVTGMDARQALRPRRGRSARPSRSKPYARPTDVASSGAWTTAYWKPEHSKSKRKQKRSMHRAMAL
ncbi:MAG: hypothetical protein E2581_26780 [Pseudomonas sp.]|nr:hypothetical protein [Pseudomonas sp.]